jgi:hypothetical protein
VGCGGEPPADEVGVAREKLTLFGFYYSQGAVRGGQLVHLQAVPATYGYTQDVQDVHSYPDESQTVLVYNETNTHDPARVGESIFFTVAGGGPHINCGIRGTVKSGVIGTPTAGSPAFPAAWNTGKNCTGTYVQTSVGSGQCTDEFGTTLSADITAIPGGCGVGFSSSNMSLSWRIDMHPPANEVDRHMARDALKTQ